MLFVQRKLAVYKIIDNKPQQNKIPVSVIICARNEEQNLKENLPYIFQQNYPNFEVIVVNDCSSDNSADLLREFQNQYSNLKIVEKQEHPRFKTGKKFAVTLGIKAASNEVLIFTDADCKPDSEEWIATVAGNYDDEQTEIVLGYSPYEKSKGLLNKIIRYETFQTAINYFSFAIGGMPYMGVGRNLSYKKTLFFKSKGFASHMHIPSGDDDLFVNENATPYNTRIEIRENSHVWSEPKKTWKSYWVQKIRHMGAGKVYKAAHKRTLSLQGISAIAFYVFTIACFYLQIEPLAVVIIFFVRFLVQNFIYLKALKRLRYKDLFLWILVLDIIFYVFICLVSIRSLFNKKVAWK